MDTIKNRGQIILRTLAIIDVLARSRRGMTSDQLNQEVERVCGKQFSVRTIRRDLSILESLSYVRCETRPFNGPPWEIPCYKLNHQRTEHFQKLAISVLDGPNKQ
jgi:hypothetical protein